MRTLCVDEYFFVANEEISPSASITDARVYICFRFKSNLCVRLPRNVCVYVVFLLTGTQFLCVASYLCVGARNFLHWRVLKRYCSLASVHCSVCQFCVHEYFSDVGFSCWQAHSFSVWNRPFRGRRATFCIGGYSHDIFVCKRVLFCAHCA